MAPPHAAQASRTSGSQDPDRRTESLAPATPRCRMTNDQLPTLRGMGEQLVQQGIEPLASQEGLPPAIGDGSNAVSDASDAASDAGGSIGVMAEGDRGLDRLLISPGSDGPARRVEAIDNIATAPTFRRIIGSDRTVELIEELGLLGEERAEGGDRLPPTIR